MNLSILILDWFWCIPSSVFGLVQPCQGLFSTRKSQLFTKNMLCTDFQMIVDHNGLNLLLTRETTIKTGILTLREFWWVP